MKSSHREPAQPAAEGARGESPPGAAVSGFGSSEALAGSRIGQTLCGKYLLERVLGVGGMAAVYAATHRNRKQFAIKILHPALSAGDGIRQRFLREGYVANSVKHPGAVAVIDDDVAEDGSAFLVMELLDGKSLEDIWVARGGALPVHTALCLAAQALDVLEAAHQHGILHRDLKPPNLFLTREGTLKVLDFGIARLQEATHQKLTSTGMTLGTPAFMAPEQVLGKTDEIDARSDIWALGATLFVLLSGQLVHDGENSQQLMVYAATRPARSLAEVDPDFPRSLVALVDQALSFDRQSRFQSAADMRRALDAVHRELFGGPVPALPHDPSAAELCGPALAQDSSMLPAREQASGERSGARRALPQDAEPAPAAEANKAPNAIISEIRPMSDAGASNAPAAPASLPQAGAPTPPAAAHVEVNIAQVQSARLPWGIAAALTAILVVSIAGIVVLLGQRNAAVSSVPSPHEAARAHAPPGADAARSSAQPRVVPEAAETAGGAKLERSNAPHDNESSSGARRPQPPPPVQAPESVRGTGKRPAARGAAPEPQPLSARCVRLLERQSLGEPLSVEERTQLARHCRR